MRPQGHLSIALLTIAIIGMPGSVACAEHPQYPWLTQYDTTRTIVARIPPPNGFVRESEAAGSFAGWLRYLPLRPEGAPVVRYDGRPTGNQRQHERVIDINVGNRDLQQCADMIIRLRAEYLRAGGWSDSIRFNFTSGDEASYARWVGGDRPVVRGDSVRWESGGAADSSYESFRDYLDAVFMYAGTYSLSRDLHRVRATNDVLSGDAFILPGFPGHAVFVVDVARDTMTGRRVMLLAQGYTPAQSLHVLKNATDAALSPWYDVAFGDTLRVQGWRFTPDQLRRF